MSQTLIKNATILTMNKANGSHPFTADILIVGADIARIERNIEPTPETKVIDATDKLVMPGLINAHIHSSETFLRGRYQGMPLEVWLLYAYPLLMDDPIGLRLLHLRSLLLAMESLKAGVTTICDDFFDPPSHDLDRLKTVFGAYETAGIRANISSGVLNIHPLDTMPYTRELVPEHLQAMLDYGPPLKAKDYLDYCNEVFNTLHGTANGRLQFMLAPSAPQRCTADLYAGCHALAVEQNVPFHTHVLETISQAVIGIEKHGKSLIAYMDDLGVLSRHTTIAHSVWVSDADMSLMGAAECSVAHNINSNLKLGSGVAPLRRLHDAGVTIGLGTDGISSNDTASVFDLMRVAALIHSAPGPDPKQWLGAEDILKMATIDGARTALLDDKTGSLEVGKAADLIMLDLTSIPFTPLNNIARQLVFAENGSSIEMVMVDGEVVVEKGRMIKFNEFEILDEIREAMPSYLEAHTKLEGRNAIFEPYFAETHRRASTKDLGMQRYAGDMTPWTLRNSN